MCKVIILLECRRGLYGVQWGEKKKQQSGLPKSRTCLKSLQQNTGAGDERCKESELRKHRQYFLISHSFLFGLLSFGSAVVCLLRLVLSTSTLKCLGTSCQPCPLYLVCSGPFRRHTGGMCAAPLPCQLFWGLKEVPSTSFTTSENCRQLHNSGQHVYTLKSGCCLLQFYF